MESENLVTLRKVFPQHVERLNACDQMLSQKRYNEAVTSVRNILREEYNRALEYARAGKIAQDSSMIQSMREIVLQFEKSESAAAGKRMLADIQKSLSGAVRRSYSMKIALNLIAYVLKVAQVEIPEEVINKLTAVAFLFPKIILDKNYRNNLVGDCKVWFWGGPRRQMVAEVCANIKNKVCGWGRSLISGFRTSNGMAKNLKTVEAGV